LFSFEKKFFFQQVILIIFLFEFDLSNIVSIFFYLIKIKLDYLIQLGIWPESRICMASKHHFLRKKKIIQPHDEARTPRLFSYYYSWEISFLQLLLRFKIRMIMCKKNIVTIRTRFLKVLRNGKHFHSTQQTVALIYQNYSMKYKKLN
jgi:hypothetical protein